MIPRGVLYRKPLPLNFSCTVVTTETKEEVTLLISNHYLCGVTELQGPECSWTGFRSLLLSLRFIIKVTLHLLRMVEKEPDLEKPATCQSMSRVFQSYHWSFHLSREVLWLETNMGGRNFPVCGILFGA